MPDPNNIRFPGTDVVFMGICKAANTAVKRAWMDALGIEGRPHRPEVLPGLSELPSGSECLLFTVIRDPIERAASCWAEKLDPAPVDGTKARLFNKKLQPGMPWPDFVEAICYTQDRGADQHFRSMSYDLYDGDRLIPHVVLRHEQLEGDWCWFASLIRQRFSIDLPRLEIHNKTSRHAPQITAEQRQQLHQRYRRDYANFYPNG